MPNVPFDERSRPGLYKLALPATESWGVVLYRGGMNWGCTQPASSQKRKAPGKTEICRSVKQEIRSLMACARCSQKFSMAANLTELNVPHAKRTPDGNRAKAAN